MHLATAWTGWATPASTSPIISSTPRARLALHLLEGTGRIAVLGEGDGWPDPMCLISALAAATTNLRFTTGVYIAPVRDLITVAKSVGTAAVLSHNRVTLASGGLV